jgi:hypothetical protein
MRYVDPGNDQRITLLGSSSRPPPQVLSSHAVRGSTGRARGCDVVIVIIRAGEWDEPIGAKAEIGEGILVKGS